MTGKPGDHIRIRPYQSIKVLIIALLCLFPVHTYADLNAFSPDFEKVMESFASEYGWNRNKISADQWIGEDGHTSYQRAAGHQKEYYEDLYNWSREFCVEYNLISVAGNGSGTGGYNIAAIARAEVDAPDSSEAPKGSNNVKYNTWYYGHPVFGEDYPWCAVFVSWCAEQCGLIDSGVYSKTAGVRFIYEYQTASNGFESYSWREVKQFNGGAFNPVPGDLFFFEGFGHIGIITAVTETAIEVTHGNSSEENVMASLMSGDGYFDKGTIVHMEYPHDDNAIFFFLTEHIHLPKSAAAGILANMEHESSFNPNALGDGGTSYGLCQWHNPDRWDRLMAFCNANGYDWQTIDGQLFYLEYELRTSYPELFHMLMSVEDSEEGAYQAAYQWCVVFEAPASKELKGMGRGELARSTYYPRYRST